MQTLCGWVPNLSGRVCDSDRLVSRIEMWGRIADTRGDVRFRFLLREDGGSDIIDVSEDGEPACTIEVLDPAGMCRVTVEDGGPARIRADMAWSEFRLMLDGSTRTLYQCTAAGRLVDRAELAEAEAVAWRFVLTMEEDADFSSHVIDRKYSRTDDYKGPSYIARTRCSVNELYFDALMDFYGHAMPDDDRQRLQDEMRRRVRKSEIAAEYLSQRYIRSYNDRTFGVAVVAVTISGMALLASLLSRERAVLRSPWRWPPGTDGGPRRCEPLLASPPLTQACSTPSSRTPSTDWNPPAAGWR